MIVGSEDHVFILLSEALCHEEEILLKGQLFLAETHQCGRVVLVEMLFQQSQKLP